MCGDSLLLEAAVVLERENHRVCRGLEGVVADRNDDVAEQNLGREGMPVRNDRLAVVPVPAIELDASAALVQISDIAVHRREGAQLVALEVRVVRAGAPVVREGLRHDKYMLGDKLHGAALHISLSPHIHV